MVRRADVRRVRRAKPSQWETKLRTIIAAAVLVAGGAAAPALAQDAAAGEELFARRCATCHMIVSPSGETIVRGGKTGPNQYGVIGRTAGGRDDFNRYGDDLQEAGEQGLVWSEELVAEYVQDPRGFLRDYLDDDRARSRMAYKLNDAGDAANVAAYLSQFD